MYDSDLFQPKIFGLHRFKKWQISKRLSNGSQFALATITTCNKWSDRRTREQITWVSYKFAECQYVHCPHFGLRIPALKENSLVVIMRLVNDGGLVKIYTMAKLNRVLHYLWVVVANTDCSSVFFNLCCQGSVRFPIVHKIAIRTPNFLDHTSSLIDWLEAATQR